MIDIGYDGTASTGSIVVVPVTSMVRPLERVPTFMSYGAGAANVKIEITQSALNADRILQDSEGGPAQYHWRTALASMTADTPAQDPALQVPTAVRFTFTGTSPATVTMSFA